MNRTTQIIRQSFDTIGAMLRIIQAGNIQRKLNVVGLMIIGFVFGSQLQAFSSAMNHRSITSSPLLYKQIDYTHRDLSIEFEPLVSGSFDPSHIISNLTPDGKMTLSLNQEGYGDINPAWLYLQAPFQNYTSTVTFVPTQQIYGGLFHCYKQYEHVFFDLKTSLLECRTKVNIIEVGGNNGVLNSYTEKVIYNAQDAFSQSDYEYGKMGVSNNIIGFDNIQLLLGASNLIDTMQRETSQSYFAGFAVLQVPTGGGTKSEWLFEPQVGTNHWGFGFGADFMLVTDQDFSFVFGGNFRHFIANWETRTFDLTENGPWSRYLLLESLDSIPGGLTSGYPAINILTQDALIEGRNQINMYARLQKRFEGCLFEMSYNLLYDEAESIKRVTPIPSGYGIYAIQTGGGQTTASTAKINQALPFEDPFAPGPIELVTSDVNLVSGAAGVCLNNSVAARLQRVQEFYTYGLGVNVDLATSSQGISSWAVWANFEILLP